MSLKECDDCGAVIRPDEVECSQCSAIALEEDVLHAQARARQKEEHEKKKAKRNQVDGYAMLERQAQITGTSQMIIKKMLAQFKKVQVEDIDKAIELANQVDKLINRAAGLGTQASRISKEMLAYQTQAHKLVDAMSTGERIHQIYVWFEKLEVPIMKSIIDRLTDIVNEAQSKRIRRAAEKSKQRKGGLGVV